MQAGFMRAGRLLHVGGIDQKETSFHISFSTDVQLYSQNSKVAFLRHLLIGDMLT